MNSLNVVFLFIVITITRVLADGNKTEGNQTSKVTKTVLHIARSLDPSKTEYLNVRGKNGEIATLIVKKREGKTAQNQTEAQERYDRKYNNPRIQDAPTLLRGAKSAVPPPVNIRSTELFVKDTAANKKKSRNLDNISIGSDGIPVVEGIRVPDDENDKVQVWRNARVVDGILVPYKKSSQRIPVSSNKQEVTLRSSFDTQDKPVSMFKDGDQIKSQWKGIAETMSVRVPTSMLPATNKPQENRLIDYITKINNRETERRKGGRSVEFEASRRMDENVDENDEPIYINTQEKELWTEHGRIKVAQRRMDEEDDDSQVSASLPLEARGGDDDTRFEPVEQPRMLQSPGVINFPTSSLYSPQGSRVSFEGARAPVLQYAHPELGVQPAKVTTESQKADKKQKLPPIKYFANDPHADRSPYAFEPGLTEDTLTDNANYKAPDVANNLDNSYDVKNIEFTTSGDPLKIDITESPRRINNLYEKKSYEDTYGLGNDKYIKRYPYAGYSGNYPISKDDYYKWKMSGMGQGTGHKGYYVKVKDNRPFWEKIGDSIKETVQSGVDSVKEMTRPVVEPIVEATQKISENLGIQDATAKISNSLGLNQGSGMRKAIQEKMGSPSSSSGIPTLGLVAGGAALGLGAIAVEKFFFNSMQSLLMSRSETGELVPLSMEHKRAMDAISKFEQKQNDTAVNKTDVVDKPVARSLPLNEKKQKYDKNEFRRLIDESGIEGLERFHFNVNENEDHQSHRRSLGSQQQTVSHIRQKRTRRDVFAAENDNTYIDNGLHSGEHTPQQFFTRLASLSHSKVWTSTPCAKRIFCDAMLRQSHDTVSVMEKRMNKFLTLIKPPVSDAVSFHIQEVMKAVSNRDCSPFICLRQDPR